MDIYLPDDKTETPKPAIFFVHGGSYLADDKNSTSETAEKLTKEGYVVVNMVYI